MKQISEQTIIKNYVKEAFKHLQIGIIKPFETKQWQFESEVLTVQVDLIGENRFQKAKAIVNHSELGKYLVFLNGVKQNPGKALKTV